MGADDDAQGTHALSNHPLPLFKPGQLGILKLPQGYLPLVHFLEHP